MSINTKVNIGNFKLSHYIWLSSIHYAEHFSPFVFGYKVIFTETIAPLQTLEAFIHTCYYGAISELGQMRQCTVKINGCHGLLYLIHVVASNIVVE